MGRIGKSFALILILVMVISSASLICFTPGVLAQNGTNVIGVIASDTTWTQAGSPYVFTGQVGITQGVTLTINPGVTVNFQQYSIQVNGTLKVQGTNGNKVFLNSDNTRFYPPQNIILSYDYPTFTAQNTIFNQTSILAESLYSNASVTINNCSFDANSAISVQGTTVLSNSTVEGAALFRGLSNVLENTFLGGIQIFDTFQLSNNNITNQQGMWVLNAAGSSPQTASITNNDIYGGSTAGINLASPANIEGNFITNNQYGISVRASTDNSIISNNTIVNNTMGIINPTSLQTISYNNFENNTSYNLSAGSTNASATNNWWGTTDQTAIGNTIYDEKNDYILGTVTFVPFLTAPNPQALNTGVTITTPTGNPTPTSSPIAPEFPAIAILPLLLSMFTVAIVVRYRRVIRG